MDILRKYLLSSVAFAAEDGAGADPDVDPSEIDPEDDEDTQDPEGETDDAESEDDEDADDDAGDGADTAGRPPRGDRQYGELRSTNRELAKQNAELTRRMAELEGRVGGAQQPQYQQAQETPAQREQRLQLLTPDERMRVELAERDQYYEGRHRQLLATVQDSGDRASFSALAGSNKYAKQYANEVERRHNDFKAKGVFVERHVILKNLLGEKVIEQAGKPRKQAAASRQRQAAAPVRSGSDVRAARRPSAGSAADLEDRYGDVPI